STTPFLSTRECAGDGLERRYEAWAECGDGANDHNDDQGRDETVLQSGHAGFVRDEASGKAPHGSRIPLSVIANVEPMHANHYKCQHPPANASHHERAARLEIHSTPRISTDTTRPTTAPTIAPWPKSSPNKAPMAIKIPPNCECFLTKAAKVPSS